MTVAILVAPLALADEPANPAAPESCALQSGGYRTVARVIDAETLQLDDGRDVRLIGALAPRAQDAGASPGAWPIETEAIRLLTSMVLGRTVKLAYGGRQTDRYGRLLAHVFVGKGSSETWVQGQMLAAGLARAYGLPGSFACSAELLAHERVARTQRRGVWSIAVYRMKPAQVIGLLMKRRSRYEIVSGAVADVSATKPATYLNFGRDWKLDFTARILKDVLAAHPAFAQTLADLKGKRIAVRGWIERRNGPLIDVRDPSQIEVLDAPEAAPQVSERKTDKPAESASTPHDALPGQAPDIPADDLGTDDDAGGDPKENRPADPSGNQPGGVDL